MATCEAGVPALQSPPGLLILAGLAGPSPPCSLLSPESPSCVLPAPLRLCGPQTQVLPLMGRSPALPCPLRSEPNACSQPQAHPQPQKQASWRDGRP